MSSNYKFYYHKSNIVFVLLTKALISFVSLLIYTQTSDNFLTYTQANSINYGISQQPITDINQLMPKLCQNQSTICEGSFCIPGVKKCVCDLRMPVQFSRYCLRQVDIETKCFVTQQCNHTIKDAVCIDINSNSILNSESSKFKLDHWQQLHDLRQQTANSNRQVSATTTTEGPRIRNRRFRANENDQYYDSSGNNVIRSNFRNSPYEINYNTQELLLQNHTRRRTNTSNIDRLSNSLPTSTTTSATTSSSSSSIMSSTSRSDYVDSASHTSFTTTPRGDIETNTGNSISTNSNSRVQPESSEVSTNNYQADIRSSSSSSQLLTEIQNVITTTAPSIEYTGNRRKMVIKNPTWPPGICSCPFGYMFDSMLRKCLAISLADSHCANDFDCKQISMTHCSPETRKCECDEPLVWGTKESSCIRTPNKPVGKIEFSDGRKVGQSNGGFIDNLIAPLILAKLFPDYLIMFMIFIVIILIVTIILFKCIAKWFSSGSSSVLISPKNKKKKGTTSSNLPPRSPYATLRRPSHKPLSDFSQATRGRILNYDFEQEEIKTEVASGRNRSPQSNTLQKNSAKSNAHERSGTLKFNKGHSHDDGNKIKKEEPSDDQLLELNDNISVNQMDQSEGKSVSSILNAIPGPPPTQQPPYMLATSAMKGQGSAIAAAAAAVANKRMQMASQKKNPDHQQQGNMANGRPVFL